MKKHFISAIFFTFLAFTENNDYLSKLSEKELETFNNLPSEIQERIIEQSNLASEENVTNDTSINFEDTVLDVQGDLAGNESDTFKKFGYSFFSGVPTTYTPINDIPVPGDYEIGIGDELEINFKGQKSGRYVLEVNKSGNIYIPEIGDVAALNFTFSELKEKIRDLFENYYLSVEASVNLINLEFIQISIIGAVKNPGTYLVNPFTTVSNLLSFAGGLEEYGSLRKIEVKGDSLKVVDLYEFLIDGDRQRVNLRAGDVIFIPSAENFILVHGEVNRPAYYETIMGDTVSDMIRFSQGFLRSANKDFFQLKSIESGKVKSILGNDIRQQLDVNKNSEIFFPKKVLSTEDNIYIVGEVSDLGPFNFKEYESLEKLIENINFTENAYKYFSVVENSKNSNDLREYLPFSLEDKSTYENISLTQGSKIYFFNVQEILDNSYRDKNIPKPILSLMEDYSVSFTGEFLQNPIFPVFGQLELSKLIDLSGGYGPAANIDMLEIIFPLDDKTIDLPSKDFTLNSPLRAYVNLPKLNSEIISVEIKGEVTNPGTYPVLRGTTLNDIYEKAGGFKSTASSDGVILLRQSLKNKELVALETARTTLINSFVDNLGSVSQNQQVGLNSQILTLIDQSYNIDAIGRVSGDLFPGSSLSKELLLQNGDEIFIPVRPRTVSIFGEVNNQVTVLFHANETLESYISKAGGFTDRADKKNIFIIKANGTAIESNSSAFSLRRVNIEPGDTIIIPKDLTKLDGLPLVQAATNILSSIAFSAASLNALKN